MHNTIYKYQVRINNSTIQLPKGAKILSVSCQGAALCVWALVDNQAELEERHLIVMGTGWDLSELTSLDKFIFIGTATDTHGLVWHVFEKGGMD